MCVCVMCECLCVTTLTIPIPSDPARGAGCEAWPAASPPGGGGLHGDDAAKAVYSRPRGGPRGPLGHIKN